jgi:antitoxin ParD1/3/4
MAARTDLNVTLTPHLSRFVESRLRSGRYASASDVVREALRLLQGREGSSVESIEELKQEIEIRLAQLRRGRAIDGEGYFHRLAARHRLRRARQA